MADSDKCNSSSSSSSSSDSSSGRSSLSGGAEQESLDGPALPVLGCSVSQSDAATLLQLLLERGYFHPDVIQPVQPERLSYGDIIPKYNPQKAALFFTKKKINNNNDNTHKNEEEEYITTLPHVCDIFRTELRARGGRWRIQDAAQTLGVSTFVLQERVLPALLRNNKNNSNKYDDEDATASSYTVIAGSNNSSVDADDTTEIWTNEYLQEQLDDLWTTKLRAGRVSVAQAASHLGLSTDMAVRVLEQRIAADNTENGTSTTTTSSSIGTVQIRLDDHASKVLVTQTYLDRLQAYVKKVLLEAESPVEIKTVARERGWEVSWVRLLIPGLVHLLPGQFQGETYYIPHQYTQRQTRAVQDFFTTNGYVTAHRCQTMFQVRPYQMKEYVQQLYTNNNNANDNNNNKENSLLPLLVLEHSVLQRTTILDPIVAAVQEATETQSWLEVPIPLDLLAHHLDDARTLLEEHVLPQQQSLSGGALCIRSEGALWFSRGLIESFVQQHIAEMVQEFARTRAKELWFVQEDQHHHQQQHQHDSTTGGSLAKTRRTSEDDNATASQTGKEKRKARKGSKIKSSGSNESELETSNDDEMISFDLILERLLKVHPDLSGLGDTSETSVLAELARTAFYTDALADQCRHAVRAELDRLASEKLLSVAKPSRFVSLDAAFADPGCFANACYLIQAKAKSLDYLIKNSDPPLDDDTKSALERDVLLGCCADFTRRITEYALYKNNVEDHAFSFLIEDEKSSIDDADFCAPIDLGTLRDRKVYLSAKGQSRDPLPLLREELPGSVGVALARQWILCGGECYQGGEKNNNNHNANEERDGASYFRPGNLEGFLAHVHEYCLPVAGLPFTKLDKKSEKKFLHARRQRLVSLLEETSDIGAALDVAIMLMYQYTKNLIVSGELLRGPVLKMLSQERKVSETVAAELMGIANQLEAGELNDVNQGDALDRIRSCVLSKGGKS